MLRILFLLIPSPSERVRERLLYNKRLSFNGQLGFREYAAGFVQEAKSHGAATLELNLERSQGSLWFDETRFGPASELVPAWVEEMLR